MEICERCDVKEDEIRLFNVIYNGKMSFLCERCSIIENVPILKKPDTSQLIESSKVYNRTTKIKIKKDETFFIEDKLRELEKNPSLELPEKNKLNLIDNFHWEVMKSRRRKGLSQKKLSEILGESELVIEMIEKGKFPENPEMLIRKLEQFFQIRLRKISEIEKIIKGKIKKPVLLDEEGVELEFIPEEEISENFEKTGKSKFSEKNFAQISSGNRNYAKFSSDKKTYEKISEENEKENSEDIKNLKDFDIKSVNINRVTIGELKKIHRKKIEATKREQVEEQKKIEERKRILEALKERDRLKIEEKRKKEEEFDKSLRGIELLKGSENFKN